MTRQDRLKYLRLAVKMAGIVLSTKDLDMILKLDEHIIASGGDTTLDKIEICIENIKNTHDIQSS